MQLSIYAFKIYNWWQCVCAWALYKRIFKFDEWNKNGFLRDFFCSLPNIGLAINNNQKLFFWNFFFLVFSVLRSFKNDFEPRCIENLCGKKGFYHFYFLHFFFSFFNLKWLLWQQVSSYYLFNEKSFFFVEIKSNFFHFYLFIFIIALF